VSAGSDTAFCILMGMAARGSHTYQIMGLLCSVSWAEAAIRLRSFFLLTVMLTEPVVCHATFVYMLQATLLSADA